eukprot:TRINITY_DN81853_c0_g1_i1.p1 TRINITY_DN81853_c0_g1~~TRINITY_DN81853_c0_g1_i1.p1  ORF type:complete len:209 (+),score=34.80 TRINITY_DN81853_c0_g1_i1:51-677(+)
MPISKHFGSFTLMLVIVLMCAATVVAEVRELRGGGGGGGGGASVAGGGAGAQNGGSDGDAVCQEYPNGPWAWTGQCIFVISLVGLAFCVCSCIAGLLCLSPKFRQCVQETVKNLQGTVSGQTSASRVQACLSMHSAMLTQTTAKAMVKSDKRYTSSWICDKCNTWSSNVNVGFYRCNSCSLDICAACYSTLAAPKPAAAVVGEAPACP